MIQQHRAILRPFDMEVLRTEVGDNQDHALYPIVRTDGLIFTIMPSIGESIGVNYDSESVPHSNEAYRVYRNTENRKITLSNVVFPADTEENARYAFAALYFFRSYSLMAFGARQTSTTGGRPNVDLSQGLQSGVGIFEEGVTTTRGIPPGRPPSPMWFSAFGSMIYNKVPVIFEGCDITTADADVDQIKITVGGDDQWIPRKLTIGSVNLTVQHPPNYWKGVTGTATLEQFRSGDLIRNR